MWGVGPFVGFLRGVEILFHPTSIPPSSPIPTPSPFHSRPHPQGIRIAGISAGRYSTQIITSDGALFVLGYDACASDGTLPPRSHAIQPRQVQGALQGRHVVALSTGFSFWVAATRTGQVFTCATGDDGYAGTLPLERQANAGGELGRGGDPNTPGAVSGIEGRVIGVAAGREHALAVTASGAVYSWGSGSRQEWLGREGRHDAPGVVGGALASERVRSVAAGEVSWTYRYQHLSFALMLCMLMYSYTVGQRWLRSDG